MAGGNDSFTKVLLHFDGTNGGTTITDNNFGGAAKTWTASSATTSTTQQKFGTASLSTGAGVGWVDTPDSAELSLGTSDFTIDCWFWIAGGNGAQRHLFGQSNSALSQFSYFGVITPANVMQFNITADGTTSVFIAGTTAFTTTGWNHYAIVRASGVMKLFINGTQEGANTSFASSAFDSANKFAVGRIGELASNNWNGFIDEFRLSVGIARWTANFTPPTAPYNIGFNADVGSFTETGSAALFRVSQLSAVASFILTGNAASFKAALAAAKGTYSVSGQAALFSTKMPASVGSYALTGNAIAFKSSLKALTTAYSVSGNAATFKVSQLAGAGSYTVTGYPSTFSRDFEAWFPRPFDTDTWTPRAIQSEAWTPNAKQSEAWTIKPNSTMPSIPGNET